MKNYDSQQRTGQARLPCIFSLILALSHAFLCKAGFKLVAFFFLAVQYLHTGGVGVPGEHGEG